jgi:hypothetical protein
MIKGHMMNDMSLQASVDKTVTTKTSTRTDQDLFDGIMNQINADHRVTQKDHNGTQIESLEPDSIMYNSGATLANAGGICMVSALGLMGLGFAGMMSSNVEADYNADYNNGRASPFFSPANYFIGVQSMPYCAAISSVGISMMLVGNLVNNIGNDEEAADNIE